MVTPRKPRFSFAPYLLLAAVVGIAFTFLILPSILSLEYSVQSYDLTRPDRIRFIWLANYIKIFQDAELRQTIFNSVYILTVMIALAFAGSIGMALALNRNFWGRQVLLAIVILPWALPSVVNSLLWSNIFSPTYGALNGLLFRLGIIDSYVVWTNASFVTLNIITLILLWKHLPVMAVIVLAAMQAIPDELYEAAEMDGADAIRKFIFVTFPAIVPSMAIVLSISSIAALNVFDEIFIIARFRGDTRSLAMEAYLEAFKFLDLGYGSAIAYVLLLAGAVFSILYMRNLYKEIQM